MEAKTPVVAQLLPKTFILMRGFSRSDILKLLRNDVIAELPIHDLTY
jgi:hypothetical protein